MARPSRKMASEEIVCLSEKSCSVFTTPNKKKRKSERQWKDEEVEQLISSYEERSCLWDFSNNDYMNRDKKDLAFSEVDSEMVEFGVTREEYKAKWKGLRSQFLREKGMEGKKKSGQSSSEVYVSSWRWYRRLKFLTVVLNSGKSVDSLNLKEASFESNDQNTEPSQSAGLRHKPVKKVKGELEQKRLLVLDKAVSILSESNQKALSDEEAFGVVVARTLSRLGERERIIARKKINNILFDAEFGAIQAMDHQPTYPNQFYNDGRSIYQL